jgi:hypothetical protein
VLGIDLFGSNKVTDISKLSAANVPKPPINSFRRIHPKGLTMTIKYSLALINQSQFAGSFVCYQQDSGIGVPGALSLAWFAKIAHPTVKVYFQWSIDYSFIWAETGLLKPGIPFLPSQLVDADPQGKKGPNEIQFTYQEGGFTFSNPSKQGIPGALTINTIGGFPDYKASVGIGMAGQGIYAVQAYPQTTYTFRPQPKYWVAFGDYTQGEVLDINQIGNKVEVVFPSNVYAMTAIYGPDGNWTIYPTSKINALLSDTGLLAYLYQKARKNNPEFSKG